MVELRPRALALACAALLLALMAAPASRAAPPAPLSNSLNSAAPVGPPIDGALLDQRTSEVSALLRCPVCQGLSVADSPATMARNMKAEVREKLAAGYSQEQILAGFESSYGEFVRLQPTLHGVNWLVWLGPFAALLLGSAAIAVALRRARARGKASPGHAAGLAHTPDLAPTTDPDRESELPSRDTLPPDPRLASAVRRVRALAYGWPEGAPPVRS